MYLHLKDLLLFGAGLLAGAINSIAGGGSFITFPTLIFSGVHPLIANASSAVALFPASFVSAWTYRGKFGKARALRLGWLVPISLLGGWLGSVLLLRTEPSLFVRLVPWLLLVATVILAFGRKLSSALKRRGVQIGVVAVVVCQLAISIYGGYFGGGIGILMLAVMAIYGMSDLVAMNAAKTLLSGCMNAAAVVSFIAAGAVDWRASLVMLAGAVSGGYLGARGAQRVNSELLRKLILVIGFGLTAYFFIRQ